MSRLLKSWATPPASRPTASIFCDWRSCSSRRLRSATCRSSDAAISSKAWTRSPSSPPPGSRWVRNQMSPAERRRAAPMTTLSLRATSTSPTQPAMASVRAATSTKATRLSTVIRFTGAMHGRGGEPGDHLDDRLAAPAEHPVERVDPRDPVGPGRLDRLLRDGQRREQGRVEGLPGPLRVAAGGDDHAGLVEHLHVGPRRHPDGVEPPLQVGDVERGEGHGLQDAALVEHGLAEAERGLAGDARDHVLPHAEPAGGDRALDETAIGEVDRAGERPGAAEHLPHRVHGAHVEVDGILGQHRRHLRAAGRLRSTTQDMCERARSRPRAPSTGRWCSSATSRASWLASDCASFTRRRRWARVA